MPSHKRKRSEFSTSYQIPTANSSIAPLVAQPVDSHFHTHHLGDSLVHTMHHTQHLHTHHYDAPQQQQSLSNVYFNPRTGQSANYGNNHAPNGTHENYSGSHYQVLNGPQQSTTTQMGNGYHHIHVSRSPLGSSFHHQHHNSQQHPFTSQNTLPHYLPPPLHNDMLPLPQNTHLQNNTLGAPHVTLSPHHRHANKRRRFTSPMQNSTTNHHSHVSTSTANHSSSAFNFNHQHQQQQQYQRNYRPHSNYGSGAGQGSSYTPRFQHTNNAITSNGNTNSKRYSAMSSGTMSVASGGGGSHSSTTSNFYYPQQQQQQHINANPNGTSQFHSTNPHHANAGWNGNSSYRSRRGAHDNAQYPTNSHYNRQQGHHTGKSSNYSKSNYHQHNNGGGGNGSQSARGHNSHDDKDGHYRFTIGEVLLNQYKIISFMGAGTFAKVVKCIDIFQNRYVAIKIIRSLRKYSEAAQIEINVLNDIKDRDLNDQFHCIRLLRSFTFRGHMCLVFPLYGTSIFDFMKKNNYVGFTMRHIQHIGRQLLSGIQFIHDEMRLIHTDLKPENVLLMGGEYDEIPLPPTATPKKLGTTVMRVPKSTDIKIIDFGSATYERDYHTAIISTRHYRAPEVILGLGWSYPADMWSAGCILFELYTGDALFQTHENKEHLAMMEKYFGPIPFEIFQRIDRATKKKYFVQNGRLNWPAMATNEESITFVTKLKPMAESLHVSTHGVAGEAFLDLIMRLLQYEPTDRLTAQEALQHRFFSLVI